MAMREPITVAGHFGELLQGRLGPAGRVALITLPCPVLVAQVSCGPGPFGLHRPACAAPLSLSAARRLLALVGRPLRGRYVLRCTMPLGAGAGASTAARVALLRAAGETDPLRIAAACLASEGASDPLMFDAPERLLWASREGHVLARGPALPRMAVIGGFFGPPRRTDPSDMAFPDITDLVQGWGAASGDLPALARLASQSAARCLALRGPAEDPTAALALRLGALGWSAAHTGSARALLFGPGGVPPGAEAALRAAGFGGITRFTIGGQGH
ncbi:propanediol utilization protein [Fuscovulum blasticum]|uniref:propanediol utilization protein n=1 Tax=Fuscovulum blasticum TaxID=1075 RepID=UPI000D504FDF|nr:propanediol utilization protein [Fuscovulum blasticum]AWD21019.1 propanediol utilization protein [Fuscovulum blasticum]